MLKKKITTRSIKQKKKKNEQISNQTKNTGLSSAYGQIKLDISVNYPHPSTYTNLSNTDLAFV